MKSLNQKGFTLLEMLLVLTITSIILLVPTLFSKQTIKNVESQLFIEQLLSSITAIQNYSILSGKMTKMEVSPENNYLRFTADFTGTHYLNHQIQMPDNVTTPTSKEYYFLGSSGNLQRFSTLVFYIDGKYHTLTFQLGSGRYKWE